MYCEKKLIKYFEMWLTHLQDGKMCFCCQFHFPRDCFSKYHIYIVIIVIVKYVPNIQYSLNAYSHVIAILVAYLCTISGPSYYFGNLSELSMGRNEYGPLSLAY